MRKLLDSAIVFSHLPSFDMYDSNGVRRDAWESDEWYKFFDNIFNAEKSKVQAIIIAKNYHSKSLETLKEKLKSIPTTAAGDYMSYAVISAMG